MLSIRSCELPETASLQILFSKISDVAGQDLNKTAGIKYIIGGVSDAYNNVTQQNGIKISIK